MSFRLRVIAWGAAALFALPAAADQDPVVRAPRRHGERCVPRAQ